MHPKPVLTSVDCQQAPLQDLAPQGDDADRPRGCATALSSSWCSLGSLDVCAGYRGRHKTGLQVGQCELYIVDSLRPFLAVGTHGPADRACELYMVGSSCPYPAVGLDCTPATVSGGRQAGVQAVQTWCC